MADENVKEQPKVPPPPPRQPDESLKGYIERGNRDAKDVEKATTRRK